MLLPLLYTMIWAGFDTSRPLRAFSFLFFFFFFFNCDFTTFIFFILISSTGGKLHVQCQQERCWNEASSLTFFWLILDKEWLERKKSYTYIYIYIERKVIHIYALLFLYEFFHLFIHLFSYYIHNILIKAICFQITEFKLVEIIFNCI